MQRKIRGEEGKETQELIVHIAYHSDENNQPLQNETTQIDYTDIN